VGVAEVVVDVVVVVLGQARVLLKQLLTKPTMEEAAKI
jgi:hypothetical protein